MYFHPKEPRSNSSKVVWYRGFPETCEVYKKLEIFSLPKFPHKFGRYTFPAEPLFNEFLQVPS